MSFPSSSVNVSSTSSSDRCKSAHSLKALWDCGLKASPPTPVGAGTFFPGSVRGGESCLEAAGEPCLEETGDPRLGGCEGFRAGEGELERRRVGDID